LTNDSSYDTLRVHSSWPDPLRNIPPHIKRDGMKDYKEIPLTKGQVAIVDAADYEWLSKFKWYATKSTGTSYYATRIEYVGKGKSKTYYMHRDILKPKSDERIDHINLDKLDNRKVNLRICSHQQNCFNTLGKNRLNKVTSKYKGVSYYARERKYVAEIRPDGKKIVLGYFENEIDAATVYNAAAQIYFGEFAWLNPVELDN
jgi:hypothetical protein